MFAVFCLRLLLLAARAGLSAPTVSLTSLEAGRLAVGVLPRDVRDVEAMPSALEGGAGEARGVLLSMAGDLVPAPALRERTSCLHGPHRLSSRHVHLDLTLGRWWQSQTHACTTHPLSRAALAAQPKVPPKQSVSPRTRLLSAAARPPHFERQPRSWTQPITLPTLCNMHTNHIAGLHQTSSHLGAMMIFL